MITKNLQSKTLLFIDSQVDDYQFLAAGVRDRVEAIVLKPDSDGIEQITSEIQKFVNLHGTIDALHIFSHGSQGCLYLGNTLLNLDNLEQYRSQLQQWQKAFSEKSNILLYGCNVAAGKGAVFVNRISELTNVNVAASVDLTGSTAKGGNWNLEFTTGEIVAPLAFKSEAMAEYKSVAGGVVGNGTPGSITEAALNAALTGGGTVTFNSGGVPVTLNLSSEKAISADTVIDGGGLITLNGNGVTRVFRTGNYLNFTVRNLTVANGFTAGNGGAILTGFQNTLNIENSQFKNNVAGAGGAIFTDSRNTVVVSNSQFDGNNGSVANNERGGGAIALSGLDNLTVKDSVFTNNKGTNGGAINLATSPLTVENSIFINNDSTPGGGIAGTSGYGGAIYTDGASDINNPDSGTILIRNSRIEGNKAAGQGGGIFLFAYAPDKAIVENSTIINNQLIPKSNGESFGGGIRVGNSDLTIRNTTIANNVSQNQGGGLWIDANSPGSIINSTFSGNRSEDPNSATTFYGVGGAIATNSSTNITNSTFANNRASFVSGAINGGNNPVTLTNSIFLNNTAGNSSNTRQNTNRELTDGGNNLQFPAKSTNLSNDFNVTATVTIADPLLGPLQDNGGGILTHALLSGSPAINAGKSVAGLTADQRGIGRDGLIDIGAFEFVATPPPPTGGSFTPNDDAVTLTEGNDSGDALAGNDLVYLLQGDDILFGNLGNDTIFGGDGVDVVNGNQGDDVINGNIGDDLLRGGQDNDLVRGGQGNDLLYGDLGNDSLFGDFGNDTIFGGDGVDVLNGNLGDDVINGNTGDDLLRGGADNDLLRGGQGNDQLLGDLGNDTLVGDFGNDTLTGGAGSDRFILEPGFAADTILDFEDGQDLLALGGGLNFGALSITQGSNGTLITVASSGELLAFLTGIPASSIGAGDFV